MVVSQYSSAFVSACSVSAHGVASAAGSLKRVSIVAFMGVMTGVALEFHRTGSSARTRQPPSGVGPASSVPP